MSSPGIIETASHSTPYFRTPEFSQVMFDNERIMLELLNAPSNSRCIFLTSSGTGAMEACVTGILTPRDNAIVINGGSFGQRFAELCELHSIPFTEVKCSFGEQLRRSQLETLTGKYTALLVNMDETSSGVLYDMNMIAGFCRSQGIMLIVDAISSFIADELDMSALGAAAVITGSQKALAVQPGVSVVAMSPEALERIESNPVRCMYLSLKLALKNMDRGQTPFTPAVMTLLQINRRLHDIQEAGGISQEREKVMKITRAFRKGISEFPFEFAVKDEASRSNAVTALRVPARNAGEIVRTLKDDYEIWVCPNGGSIADEIFRVGHMGHITPDDIDTLLGAMKDMMKKGAIR